MLLALWSPKGGSGTSVLAAACALVLGRRGGARLADLDGDQPALFGLASDPPTGLVDWLGAGPEAPTDALERLTVEAAAGVALIPAARRPGRWPLSWRPRPAPPSGSRCATASSPRSSTSAWQRAQPRGQCSMSPTRQSSWCAAAT